MRDIHPSESGGTGEKIPRGRYLDPKDAPDNRRECYQCGFITNDDSDVESDSYDSPGLQAVTSAVAISNTVASLPQPLKTMPSFLVASKNVTEMQRVAGCPFCGTTNRKGRFRDQDPFLKSVDISAL